MKVERKHELEMVGRPKGKKCKETFFSASVSSPKIYLVTQVDMILMF